MSSVEKALFNSWASCYVVIYKLGHFVDAIDWLASQPRRSPEIPVVPEQVAVVSSSEEQVADEGDEKFVPSRIIPPFCSPGLGIAAGQFSLPPLAVGLFIIDSSNLSFKRS